MSSLVAVCIFVIFSSSSSSCGDKQAEGGQNNGNISAVNEKCLNVVFCVRPPAHH